MVKEDYDLERIINSIVVQLEDMNHKLHTIEDGLATCMAYVEDNKAHESI